MKVSPRVNFSAYIAFVAWIMINKAPDHWRPISELDVSEEFLAMAEANSFRALQEIQKARINHFMPYPVRDIESLENC